jgi:putative membrane protein
LRFSGPVLEAQNDRPEIPALPQPLIAAYPWIKVLHLLAIVAWMAGLFYLPRLFVYHAERGTPGSELSETFKVMERRLLKAIMRPAMIATWIFGLTLAGIPGVVDWGAGWIYVKLAAVLALTWFHHWLLARMKDFAEDRNEVPGRRYRLMNEIPTVALVIIVIMVIVKPF